MSFTIFTTVSNSYQEVADFCLPSWFKHSGADQIDVRYYRGSQADTLCSRWFDNLMERCRAMQDAVRQAVRHRRKLLLMDADCLVLKDLAAGFSDNKPFSVTRWRNINMGVMFLNTSLKWPFVAFFDEFVCKALVRCQRMKAERNFTDAGDQDIMWKMLWEREDDVAKLDYKQWNFTYSHRTSDCDLRKHKDRVRILHMRFKSFGCDLTRERLQALRSEFPEAFRGAQ